MYSLALHGGAGTILREQMTEALEQKYLAALEYALNCGEQLLAEGASAVEAVEATVRALEDSPLFNAGKGSVLTHEGEIETDASIMDGNGLHAGSAAFVKGVRNPISLARAVMDDGDFVMLSGPGAAEFAQRKGLEMAPHEYFTTEFRRNQLIEAQKHDRVQLDHSHDRFDEKHGTVGAVALDIHGNLAAATSTGGLTNKRYGRIGDSALIGSGTYANNATCAVSCTGYGEYYIRGVVAYDVHALMEYGGKSLQEACDIIIHDKQIAMGSDGGLIAVDRHGNIALPFNSDGMYRASVKRGEQAEIRIYK